MLIHCSEHGINFGIGLGCNIVGMVCVPYVWMRRISNDVAMWGRDLSIAEATLPPIGLGNGAREVVNHDRWSCKYFRQW
jgi:hypothetical protein